MIHAADHHLPGHRYAKAPLDMALWDLTARTAGVPLYNLFGGLQTRQLPLYHSISCIDPDEMAQIAIEETARGITQIQVKLGPMPIIRRILPVCAWCVRLCRPESWSMSTGIVAPRVRRPNQRRRLYCTP